MSTATRTVKVRMTQGLHLRPCSAIVTAAGRHRARVQIQKDGQSADAESLLELLMLAATRDTELVVLAQGADAQEAVQAVAELFAGDF